MTIDTIRDVVFREPFRPFTLRMSNGAQYTFNSARDLGASKGLGTIVHFGEGERLALLDRENIVEVIQ